MTGSKELAFPPSKDHFGWALVKGQLPTRDRYGKDGSILSLMTPLLRCIGIAGGPLGAIAGTIPGLVIGGIIGYFGGSTVGERISAED